MAEQPDQEKKVTSKGAVEIEEERLDEAAGGTSGDDMPTESVSFHFNTVKIAYAKPEETSISQAPLGDKKI